MAALGWQEPVGPVQHHQRSGAPPLTPPPDQELQPGTARPLPHGGGEAHRHHPEVQAVRPEEGRAGGAQARPQPPQPEGGGCLLVSLDLCFLDPACARVLDVPKNDHGRLYNIKPHTSFSPVDNVGDAGGQLVATLRRSDLPALFLIKPDYIIFS